MYQNIELLNHLWILFLVMHLSWYMAFFFTEIILYIYIYIYIYIYREREREGEREREKENL